MTDNGIPAEINMHTINVSSYDVSHFDAWTVTIDLEITQHQSIFYTSQHDTS